MARTRPIRLILAAAAALLVATAGAAPAQAADIAFGEGSIERVIPVTGSIGTLTLSVTHPVAAAWTIDPNNENPFTAPDIEITNLSKVRIRVGIQSLAAAAAPVLDDPDEVLLEDVGAADKPWDLLNAEDSMRFIALGVFARQQTGWDSGAHESVAYAADIDGTPMGTLSAGGSGAIGFSACHGLAVARRFVAAHTLVLTFSVD